ncbi:nucleoside deaminase [Streptomyces sp. NPDC051183]|uniref:nucleoside deaminase n=1 Tax=Streptomyces sp. NPDC051183 TaxID=3155165 RepID=UPI0034439908
MQSGETDFYTAWRAAPPAVRRSLALAYEALTAGGLAVGAVLADPAGAVLSEGRNEAYEDGPGPGAGSAPGPGAGPGPLRGTPLAHAEMNALGAARTAWDLGAAVLWSTQEPCGMCAAAARFTGVGEVRYLAPDPWALAGGSPEATASRACGGVWLPAANVMFLRSVAVAATGPAEPRILTRHRAAEPETAALHDLVPAGLPTAPSVEAWLEPLWPHLARAAAARAGRTG